MIIYRAYTIQVSDNHNYVLWNGITRFIVMNRLYNYSWSQYRQFSLECGPVVMHSGTGGTSLKH